MTLSLKEKEDYEQFQCVLIHTSMSMCYLVHGNKFTILQHISLWVNFRLFGKHYHLTIYKLPQKADAIEFSEKKSEFEDQNYMAEGNKNYFNYKNYKYIQISSK